MNIYGEQVGLEVGGVVRGDLEVLGDLDVEGTLTTDVLISRESVETKDALLHLGLDNVADTSNLGIFWEYNAGGRRYGGIARDAVNKKIRVFEDQAVKPTPSADISTFALGDLQCDVMEAKQITLGTQPAEYILPAARGLAGQTIKATGVAGTEWGDANVFDQSLNTTDDVKFNLVDTPRIYNSLGPLLVPGDLTVGNPGGAGVLKIQGFGASEVACLVFFNGGSKMGDLDFADAYASFQTGVRTIYPIDLRFFNQINPYATVDSDFKVGGALTVGHNTPATEYVLPATRGALGQLLVTDGAGVVSWQTGANPFDQTLNIADSVVFGALTIGAPVSSYVLPSTRGGNNQILKTNSFGVVSWQSDNPFNQSLNTSNVPTFTGLAVSNAITNASISTDSPQGAYSSFIGFRKAGVQLGSIGVDLSNDMAMYNQAGEVFHSPAGTLDLQCNGAVTATGTLTASGDWVHDQCAIEIYSDVNVSPTPCVTGFQPYQVVFGAATVGYQNSFTGSIADPTAMRITYNGTRTRRFMLSATISFQTNTDSVIVNFFLYKNGLAIPGTKVTMFHTKGTSPQSTQIQSLPQMTAGDYVELYVSCQTANVDVIVTSANVQCFCLSNLV